MSLERLYRKLERSPCLSYKADVVVLRGETPSINPIEEIVLQGHQERLRLIQLQGGTAVGIDYEGDRDRLLTTIKGLDIPNRWPENLGHRAFYLIRGRLKNRGQGLTQVSQIVTGREDGLVLVLNQLIRCYETQAAAKDILSGEMRS
ncbi:MAG: hypothetical protein AABX70_01165 [Nanoarchaeota archaeon]